MRSHFGQLCGLLTLNDVMSAVTHCRKRLTLTPTDIYINRTLGLISVLTLVEMINLLQGGNQFMCRCTVRGGL